VRRREFITLLGGAAAWPLGARAQQPAMPVIGFLRSTTAASAAHLVTAFRQGLKEAGFIEGQNVAIEFRWADDHNDRLLELAADLIRRQAAVIVTHNQSTPAAKAATRTTPIVFVSGGDPIRDGLVSSLSRPGGNVTGVSFTSAPLDAKRLGLLHELVPKAVGIAMLLDPNSREPDAQLQNIEAAARAVGRKILIVKAGSEREFNAAFSKIAASSAGALLVGSGAFFLDHRRQLVTLSARHTLPASYVQREYVEAGGLMSYGASQADAYRRASIYVGRILKGEKPGDLPVQLPTKFEFVINLAAARALSLEFPPQLLALADEVIE
jgi:putative tryptophan/tyrosine transport system substrate-binding protein